MLLFLMRLLRFVVMCMPPCDATLVFRADFPVFAASRLHDVYAGFNTVTFFYLSFLICLTRVSLRNRPTNYGYGPDCCDDISKNNCVNVERNYSNAVRILVSASLTRFDS